MKSYACAAALAAAGLLAAGQASACPGAKGAPIIQNQGIAYALFKVMFPQILPGYSLQPGLDATSAGGAWVVTAEVAASATGAPSDSWNGQPAEPKHGLLSVRFDACTGGAVAVELKPG